MAGRGLIASHFTLAGDVHPFIGDGVSPFPLRDRIEVASRAGFCGIGLEQRDLQHWLKHWSAREIAAMLADNGLDHVELELLTGWFGPDNAATRQARDFLLEMAAVLVARHIKIGSSGPALEDAEIAGCFASLCDAAEQAGTAIVLEVSPIGRICSLERGRKIVEMAGRANGGLLLDIWHVMRSGIALSAIAQLAPGIVLHAEICDGAAAPEGDYIEDTTERRLSCGNGVFPIDGFLSALEAAGHHGPVGVEILSNRQRRLPIADAAASAIAGLNMLI